MTRTGGSIVSPLPAPFLLLAPSLLSAPCMLLAACGEKPGAATVAARPGDPGDRVAFEECAADRGLEFTWRSGHDGRFLNPEIVGGGAALLDHDGDGDLDVYFVQGGSILDGGGVNRLFRNDGSAGFVDVTDSTNAGDPGYGMGVAAADYDHDGDVDLYVTNLGRNTLLRNDGGRFVDVTEESGTGGDDWSTSCMFVDLDLDGLLDLYVCSYLHWSPGTERECTTASGSPDYCAPSMYQAPAIDRVYRNLGNGAFEEVTSAVGVDRARGTSLGVTSTDFTGDGRPDVFVANDGMMNHLWTWADDDTVVDTALERGCALDEAGRIKAGMGVGLGDPDGDGDLDLLVVNLRGETDSYFRNEGDYMRDHTGPARLGVLSRGFTRFGVGFVDVDNDGVLDLFEANGRVMTEESSWSDDPYAEPNLLMRGGPDGFSEWLPRGGTTEPVVRTSRAAVFGDLDNDGGVDVVIVNRDGRASLLRNVTADRGHWLLARLIDQHGRDAIGASVWFDVEGATIRREVQPAYSYLASNDPRVHVGLGDAATIRTIRVRWPDGVWERFGPVEADQVVSLRRGGGRSFDPDDSG